MRRRARNRFPEHGYQALSPSALFVFVYVTLFAVLFAIYILPFFSGFEAQQWQVPQVNEMLKIFRWVHWLTLSWVAIDVFLTWMEKRPGRIQRLACDLLAFLIVWVFQSSFPVTI